MTGLPEKILNGQLGLPVWKPERVFNLSAIEVNIEGSDPGESPTSGPYFTGDLIAQLWVADKKDSPYICVASVTMPAKKYRAFKTCGFVNAYGFQEVVRIPSTAQVVAVTNASDLTVQQPPGAGPGDTSSPQVDIKPFGTFL